MIVFYRDLEFKEDEAMLFLKQRQIFDSIRDYAILPKGVSRVSGAENIIIGTKYISMPKNNLFVHLVKYISEEVADSFYEFFGDLLSDITAPLHIQIGISIFVLILYFFKFN